MNYPVWFLQLVAVNLSD